MNQLKVSTMALALTGLTAATVAPQALANPFAMTQLSSGYQLVAAEGNCGAKKTEEASCGANKKLQEATKVPQQKMKQEGKCGEGKCGAEQKMKQEATCGTNKKMPEKTKPEKEEKPADPKTTV
ncbi:hypothetical protein KDN34_01825 [Shewanella yunxiaonensis]|uniref:Low-complexity protein n=1 Tax=Shewanella yunxiaonensis TaxID=2829809 RepID=A0ABX7YTZ6_9GAMM|nr:hypothetical protein [Shewanella yunxiaonensis]QUN06234.1 hypothetical protein KDN34_01825 [Shewanella yunxiaonensis]